MMWLAVQETPRDARQLRRLRPRNFPPRAALGLRGEMASIIAKTNKASHLRIRGENHLLSAIHNASSVVLQYWKRKVGLSPIAMQRAEVMLETAPAHEDSQNLGLDPLLFDATPAQHARWG
jgi:hypothetical protein